MTSRTARIYERPVEKAICWDVIMTSLHKKVLVGVMEAMHYLIVGDLHSRQTYHAHGIAFFKGLPNGTLHYPSHHVLHRHGFDWGILDVQQVWGQDVYSYNLLPCSNRIADPSAPDHSAEAARMIG